VKAIILSAGQGRRLLPLTEGLPKCLLPVSLDHTMLSWQLSQLAAAGVDEAVVVTGFEAERVEHELARQPYLAARTIYNPFYDCADNLGSVWCALAEFDDDTLLLNGDTLFRERVADRLIARAERPITMTISQKPAYDDDDMKVELCGAAVAAIGKSLAANRVGGESIGMTLFRGTGPATFRAAVFDWMRRPDARRLWYLSVLDALARQTTIATCEAAQDEWCEVDVADDLEQARRAVASWIDGASRSDVGVGA
jgi:choline kinase